MRRFLTSLIVLSLLLEVGSLTFLQHLLGLYSSPVVFVGSGLLLTYFLLQKLRQAQASIEVSSSRSSSKVFLLIPVVICIALGWLWMRRIFPHYAIDPQLSDIIPSIRVYTNRFSNGKDVYTDFSDFGYTISPTYLPFMWLPFVPADFLKLDYRTWAYGIMWVSIILLILLNHRKRRQRLLLFIVPLLLFLIYLHYHPDSFGWTVETMIAGFYLLLVAGLFYQKVWLISLGIICCLLSRYAVVLLLPFLLVLYGRFEKPKKTIAIASLSVLGVLLLFVCPFLIHHPQLLSRGYQYYTQAALGEWQGQGWQKPGELPYQLSQGFGFAIFFYNKNDVAGSLQLYQLVHKVVSVAVPLAFATWYFLRGRNWLTLHQFSLVLLHTYLVCFFAFIQVPYAYLFLTPILVSVVSAILLWQGTKKQ